MTSLVRKSIAASIFIALGDYVLLKLGNPLGPFLFSLGLLAVCYLGANLFTGKCGFLIADKIKIKDLLTILLVNLLAGFLLGLLFRVADSSIIAIATEKVASWSFSFSFFVRSILCGVVMYIAVAMYRQGTAWGILFGIPLFIFSGFQHCIANVITLGVAATFDWSLVICVLGNFIGSLATWYFVAPLEKAKKCTTSKATTKNRP